MFSDHRGSKLEINNQFVVQTLVTEKLRLEELSPELKDISDWAKRKLTLGISNRILLVARHNGGGQFRRLVPWFHLTLKLILHWQRKHSLPDVWLVSSLTHECIHLCSL